VRPDPFGRLGSAALAGAIAGCAWLIAATFGAIPAASEIPSLLACPRGIRPLLDARWSIAGRAPSHSLTLIPLEPLPAIPPRPGETARQWTIWGQGTPDPTGNLVFGAVGDHGATDARVRIFAYDPRSGTVTLSPEINASLGARPGAFADGKIHGRLDFFGGPWIWFATYWAKYPEPSAADYASGYRGGHIARYNVRTGEIVDEGVPLPHASWPSHRIDGARGIFYAAGHFSEFLAWDIRARKPLYAGKLPGGWTWGNRVILLDEPSGTVYSSDVGAPEAGFPLLRYDPALNRFERLPVRMPAGEKGERTPLRAHTDRRGPDGLFWAMTQDGTLFSYDPEKRKMSTAGSCWPGTRRYTTALVRSPKGRYLYYLPGAHGDAFLEGAPVVQYDTRLGRFKVLAFLGATLLAEHGYLAGGTYSIVLDAAGATLLIFMNGAARSPGDSRPLPQEAFGAPAVLALAIPPGERIE
jgi:hypothetical protein